MQSSAALDAPEAAGAGTSCAQISSAVAKGGGKAITMYGMRHCFASYHLIAGVSDVKVARWLGHADTRMVHLHYGHLLSYDDDINAIGRPREDA